MFSKNTPKKYLVGFDLRDDYCQISYYFDDAHGAPKEPETFALVEGTEEYNIPTVLSKRPGTNQWVCGQEAVRFAQSGEGILINHLVNQALDGRPVQVEEMEYAPAALLALFINRCLLMLGSVVPADQIAALLFTCEEMSPDMIAILEIVRERLRLSCEFLYESHADSFFHYMLMQDPELREKAVLLCELDEGRSVHVSRLIFNTRTTPVVAYREEQTYPPLPMDDPAKDAAFNAILEEQFAMRFYNSAFLLGEGFNGGWLNRSIRTICQKCRAFQGNNLFSKGAAFGALIRTNPPKGVDKFFFLADDKLKSNIGIYVISYGEEIYFPLVDAGGNWYDVHRSEELILEEENEIRLLLTPLTGEEKREFPIRLDELPRREGRTTRIRLNFEMLSARKVRITIEDLGFGEIFPSTGLTWEQQITLTQ